MPEFRDQLNRVITLNNTPKRIITIVPSQTELLLYIGLDKEIAGITNFCVHPADKLKAIPRVGGPKQLNIDKIRSLKPDLIIANKEENDRYQVELLMQIYPVWVSNVKDIESALQMIATLGDMVGRCEQANTLCAEIVSRFNIFFQTRVNLNNLKVAYLIWRKPYMVAGAGTYIDHMLYTCGLINVIKQDRYPVVDQNELIRLNPSVIFLSSEPYPFGQKHIAEFNAILPNAHVMLVDGEMFSWYGSRLLLAPGYLGKLINELNEKLTSTK